MRFLSVAVVLISSFSLFSQYTQPERGPVYTDTLVPRIDIFIDPDSLAAILNPANAYSDYEYPATFVFTTPTYSDTITDIGFRLRGNTSRQSAKKSFKVSFNTFIRGRKYQGFEKLNLNGEHNDPSITRSKLFWDLQEQMGLPAPRANHVELYINGQYRGLYINVEHIDENFTASRFGSDYGNLYKCTYPADMTFRGRQGDDYKFMQGGKRVYELKINEDRDDYSGLAHLIDILNNTPDSLFACTIETVFHVETYLKSLAIEVFAGHWDSPHYLGNNFYLYFNPQTGLCEYLSYDADNTFGIDWLGQDWGIRDIYQWSPSNQSKPLYDRFMRIPEYRHRFTYYLQELMDKYGDTSVLFPQIDRRYQMILPYAANDVYRTYDYGFTLQQFTQSYDTTIGVGHVQYGLKQYITTRLATARQQLQPANLTPLFLDLYLFFQGFQDSLLMNTTITDDDLQQVSVQWTWNGGPVQTTAMRNDGLYGDHTAGDDDWAVHLPPLQTNGILTYQFVATDSNSHIVTYPCFEPFVWDMVTVPPLTINEFMSDNETSITDESGDYDDWIELYNPGPAAIQTAGLTLSDKLDNPGKWSLPDTLLEPGAFLLIWADEDPGTWHTNFKLSNNGEAIGLYRFAGPGGYLVVDTLTFGPMDADESFGCYPDGTRPIITQPQPTPGYSNLATSVAETPSQSNLLTIYPNPARGQFTIDASSGTLRQVTLTDMQGKTVAVYAPATSLVTLPTPTIQGIYLVTAIYTDAAQGEHRVYQKLVVQ